MALFSRLWRSEPPPLRRPGATRGASTIIDQFHDPVLFIAPDLHIVDANRAAEAFYGYSRPALLQLTVFDLRHPREHAALPQLIEAAAVEPRVFQTVHVRSDGQTIPVEVSTRYDSEDGVFISIVRGLTDRQHAEERIKSLNRLLRTRAAVDEVILRERDPTRLLQGLCENAVRAGELHGAVVGIAHNDGRITIEARSGSTPAYLDDSALRWDEGPPSLGPGGTSVREKRTVVVADATRDPHLASRRAGAAATDVRSIVCAPIVMKDRVFGFLAFLAAEPRVFEGEVRELIDQLAADVGFALQVIADRRRHEEERTRADAAQQQLAAERDLLVRRLALQFDRMPVGCVVTDVSDRVIAWNAAAERIFGYADVEVLGREIFPLLVRPEQIDAVRATVHRSDEANEATETDAENVTKGGRAIQCRWTTVPLEDDSGRLLGRMRMVQDVSETRRLEEELRQAQKMEAIGRLAGGVAHDFNNLLTIVLGNCDEALAALPATHPQRANVADIHQAALRAAALTRQLLAFSRRQIMHPEHISINEIVEKMSVMLRRIIGADVTLITELDSADDRVHADPGQVEQILLNLCINARDAMPAGGTLTIRTARMEIGAAERLRDPAMSEGPHLCLTVRDTGTGIPDEVKSHVFEPFFTTKEQGKGTGLGLATVYGIVRQSRGGIYFESVPDGGTAFTVAFRLSAAPQPGAPPSPEARPPQDDASGCVMIVEDEAAVRSLTRRALAGCGYSVLEATCGSEALDAAAAHPGEIDVLVTDVVMPGMSGPELAGRMRAMRPRIRVLYISGYSEALALGTHQAGDRSAFLQKPFTVTDIREQVRSLLHLTS